MKSVEERITDRYWSQVESERQKRSEEIDKVADDVQMIADFKQRHRPIGGIILVILIFVVILTVQYIVMQDAMIRYDNLMVADVANTSFGLGVLTSGVVMFLTRRIYRWWLSDRA